MSDAIRAMVLLALGAFGIAGLASLWMARGLSRPIDTLSRSLGEMTQSRSFDQTVPETGSSQEVDALTRTFNTMMQSVSGAQAETRSAYVGAIRALALALDARDPYTAGHSERVSAISVAVGRQLGVPDADLDVLRLGALLHDIGKIGISDAVLRKPDALTPAEYDLIKEHPGLGARILRSVPFLAPHLPIVELHHERPDGRGYPYGLTSEQTPLLARIVHVADAFDAMTSVRAYRPAWGSGEAVHELWRCAGTQFDAEVVQALVHALPSIGSSAARFGTGRRHGCHGGNAASDHRQELNVRFTARRSSALIAALLLAFFLLLPPSQAAAQNGLAGRAAIEAVASIATSSADGIDDPFVVFDLASTFRVTDGLDAIVRPYARRLPGGDWDAVFYQAQIRYQPAERVRIDAGIITSPMGLGTFELRPDLNPLVGYPFYYFGRLPAFDEYNNQRADPVGRISARRAGQRFRNQVGCPRGGDRQHAREVPEDLRGDLSEPDGAGDRRRGRDAVDGLSRRRRDREGQIPELVGFGVLRPAAGRLHGHADRRGCARHESRSGILVPLHEDFRRTGAGSIRHQRRSRGFSRVLRPGRADDHAADLCRRALHLRDDADEGVDAIDAGERGSQRRVPADSGADATCGIRGIAPLREDGLGPRGGGVHRLGAALVLKDTKNPVNSQLPNTNSQSWELGVGDWELTRPFSA